MNEGMEIIVIEDDEEDAARIMKFLKANVTNPVRLLHDGAEAAEFILFETDSVPKLILLDLMLPYVDGFELYRMIKSEPKSRKLSVIFLISSPKTKEYIESIGIHPDGYLLKCADEMAPVRLD